MEGIYKIHQGSNGNWFLKLNDVLMAGFTSESDANIFVKAKREQTNRTKIKQPKDFELYLESTDVEIYECFDKSIEYRTIDGGVFYSVYELYDFWKNS